MLTDYLLYLFCHMVIPQTCPSCVPDDGGDLVSQVCGEPDLNLLHTLSVADSSPSVNPQS